MVGVQHCLLTAWQLADRHGTLGSLKAHSSRPRLHGRHHGDHVAAIAGGCGVIVAQGYAAVLGEAASGMRQCHGLGVSQSSLSGSDQLHRDVGRVMPPHRLPVAGGSREDGRGVAWGHLHGQPVDLDGLGLDGHRRGAV